MKIAVLLIPFLSSLVQEVTKAELTGVARARELSLYNTRNKASADGVFLDDFYVVVCCKFLSILLLQARGIACCNNKNKSHLATLTFT